MTDIEVDDFLHDLESREYKITGFDGLKNVSPDAENLLEKFNEAVNYQYLIEELKLIRIVTSGNDDISFYSLTKKGRKVLRQGGWLKYLERKDKIEIKKEKKEDFELEILEFQAKYPRLPYYLAFASVFISFLAFINSCHSENKLTNESRPKEVFILKDTLSNKSEFHKKQLDTLKNRFKKSL